MCQPLQEKNLANKTCKLFYLTLMFTSIFSFFSRVANDDMYASNVPDSLSSSSASSLDTPLSVEGSEESGRTSGSSKSTRSKKESIKDGGEWKLLACVVLQILMLITAVVHCKMPSLSLAPMEVEIRYLSQLRRSPYPISSLHKVCHKAPHNHFKQHSDIKRKGRLSLLPYVYM